MSSRTKILSAVVMSFAILATGVAVSAQEAPSSTVTREKQVRKGEKIRRHSYMRMRQPSIMREIRGLDLTDAQKAQVKIVLDNFKMDESTRTELKAIMQAKADGTATEEQNARLKAIHEQKKQNNELIRIQVEALLTPEQKEKLETRRAERQKRMEERKKMRELKKESSRNN